MIRPTTYLVFAVCLVVAVHSQKSIDGRIESLSQTINRMGEIMQTFSHGEQIVTDTQKLIQSSNARKVNQGNSISEFISPQGVLNIDQIPEPVRKSINNDLNTASNAVWNIIKDLDFTGTKIDLSRVAQQLKANTIRPWRKRRHIVPSKQVAVDVFFEGLCPDSRAFIKQQLAVYFPLFAPYIDLTLIPFGKANSTPHGFLCQHGPNECKANMIMSCALRLLPRGQLQVSFTDCYMTNPFESGRLQECTGAAGISEKDIDNCVHSSTGLTLQLEAEKVTKRLTPGPKFVPTVIFNKRYDEDDQQEVQGKNFFNVLCRYLPTAPPCL